MLKLEIQNLERSIAQLEQALTIATTPTEKLPYEPAVTDALELVRLRIAAQASEQQKQAEIAAIKGDLAQSKANLRIMRQKQAELEQRVNTARKTIAASAAKVSALSEQLEQAIAILRQEAIAIEVDWETLHGRPPLHRTGAASGDVPVIEEQRDGFLLSARRVNWI